MACSICKNCTKRTRTVASLDLFLEMSSTTIAVANSRNSKSPKLPVQLVARLWHSVVGVKIRFLGMVLSGTIKQAIYTTQCLSIKEVVKLLSCSSYNKSVMRGTCISICQTP